MIVMEKNGDKKMISEICQECIKIENCDIGRSMNIHKCTQQVTENPQTGIHTSEEISKVMFKKIKEKKGF